MIQQNLKMSVSQTPSSCPILIRAAPAILVAAAFVSATKNTLSPSPASVEVFSNSSREGIEELGDRSLGLPLGEGDVAHALGTLLDGPGIELIEERSAAFPPLSAP